MSSNPASPKPLKIKLSRPTTTPLPTDPKWDEKAQDALLDALPKMRGTAEKWAATVGTLTGLFTTVVLVAAPAKINDIDPAWRVGVTWVVVGTVICTATAVGLASLAAQGGSAKIVPTGPAYQELSARETQRARNFLNASRSLTLFAVLALAGAFALAALHPKEETAAQNVSVTYQAPGEDTQTLCGTLQQTSSGVKIRPGGGQADKTLPLTAVKTITPVTGCG